MLAKWIHEMHTCFLAIMLSFAVRSIVNENAYSLLEKKFLEFLISVRRLKVFMEAGNLEPKTDHSIHFLHARG